MKKNIFLFVLTAVSLAAYSQADPDQPPYKNNPSFPGVKLLLPDSVSFFTKNNLDKKSTVLLMLFNPQCEHCQHETEQIIQNIDQFKKVQIVMATSMPFDSMIVFRKKYNLAKYKNITVTQDTHFFLIGFFTAHSLPFLAFYNRKKELISVFEGSMPIDKMVEELKK